MSSTSVLNSTPETVTIAGDRVIVRMSDGSEVSDDLTRYERLRKATSAQRNNWQWIGHRTGIHWPEVDEDLSIHGIVRDDQVRRDATNRLPLLIAQMMRFTQELERLFPGRKFTPDGHLVGSIGEVVAQHIYDLVLEPCSTPLFDARTKDAKTVQIKLTGKSGKSYGVRWSNSQEMIAPDYLIALKLEASGFTEIYNGAFPTEMLVGRNDQKNGQIPLSVSRLAERNLRTLPQVYPLSDFNRLFEFESDSAA